MRLRQRIGWMLMRPAWEVSGADLKQRVVTGDDLVVGGQDDICLEPVHRTGEAPLERGTRGLGAEVAAEPMRVDARY
jgi:hypothetical protein